MFSPYLRVVFLFCTSVMSVTHPSFYPSIHLFICLFVCVPCTAAAQLAGQQPHAGQGSRGARHAGVRHHQRQDQEARRPAHQDAGRPAGV